MKRIIGLILVIATLALTLASCAYSFTKDDVKQYASFNREKFEKAISELVIADGSYTADKRDALQLDNIYATLAGKADTADKLKTGVVDGNDTLYYCYYITFEKDGKTLTVAPTYMNTSKALSMQLGLSTLEGYRKDLSDKLAGSDMKDYAYSITTSGASKDGQLAYINYTISTPKADGVGTTDENYKLVAVRLDKNSTDPVIKALTGKNIGTTVDSFTDETTKIKYSNLKIEWVVEETDTKKYKEIVLDPIVVYTDSTELEATDGVKYQLKDVELTYHVCPVYYLDVEDFTAEVVIRTLLSSITEETYDIFSGHKELIDAYNEKVKALTEMEGKLEDAEEELSTAKKNLDSVIASVPEGENPDEKDSVKAAKEDVANKEKVIEGDGTTKGLKTQVAEADAAVVTAMNNLFKAIGEAKKTAEGAPEADKNADATELGKTAVVDAYKKSVHENLLAGYNTEIKENLAKALWAAMTNTETITFIDLPKKAVDEVFDRLMQEHQYNFRKTGTNYKDNNGSFEEYLIKKTAVTSKTYADAEAKVKSDAEALVKELVTIYLYADAYGLTYTDAEYNEYKNDPSGKYDSNVYNHGEMFTAAAYQFDKLFNDFLAVETETVKEGDEEIEKPKQDENGGYIYTNEFIKKFTFKADEKK